MLKRLLLSLTAGGLVFGLTTGFASGFNSSAAHLSESTVAVTSCVTNVHTTSVLDSTDPTRIAAVHVVDQDTPASGCAGAQVGVALLDTNGNLVGKGLLNSFPSSGAADVDITTSPLPTTGQVASVRVRVQRAMSRLLVGVAAALTIILGPGAGVASAAGNTPADVCVSAASTPTVGFFLARSDVLGQSLTHITGLSVQNLPPACEGLAVQVVLVGNTGGLVTGPERQLADVQSNQDPCNRRPLPSPQGLVGNGEIDVNFCPSSAVDAGMVTAVLVDGIDVSASTSTSKGDTQVLSGRIAAPRGGAGRSTLPRTGAEVGAVLMAALSLLAVGWILTRAGRARSTADSAGQ